jgi:hypothetical protein
VQDLQRDLAAFGVHRVGHLAVARARREVDSVPAKGLAQPADVGRKAAGDDQAHAALARSRK